MWRDRERECAWREIECVQNDRNVFMSRDRERERERERKSVCVCVCVSKERHKRTASD